MQNPTKEVANYQRNVGKLPSPHIKGVLIPESIEQLGDMIRKANSTGTKLYPISSGRNWGFGSKLPQGEGQTIVNLCRLNKVEMYDEKHGVVRVQPGVTQIQLAIFLRERGSNFYLDVTGSGAETSVLANALERGIAYNGQKTEQAYGFSCLDGTGKFIKGGFASIAADHPIGYLYEHDLGPSLDGLFLQSNLGIVISGYIKLRTRQKFHKYFSVSFDTTHLSSYIGFLRSMHHADVFTGIARTGDFSRSLQTSAPIFKKELENLGLSYDPGQVEALFMKMHPREWTSFGCLEGEKEIVQSRLKIFKRNLKMSVPKANIQIFDDRLIDGLATLYKALRCKHRLAYLNVGKSFLGLTRGNPSDAALPMTAWPEPINGEDVDSNAQGLLFLVPLIPFDPEEVSGFYALIEKLKSEWQDVQIGVTLNPLSARTLEAVVSLKFFHSVVGHKAADVFSRQFSTRGWLPYRLANHTRKQFVHADSGNFLLFERLKEVFDPKGVIAPNRYNLS